MTDLDLRGKDYFTQAEAAHYMCRSLSKFKTTAKRMKIPHFVVDGIKMYRRSDLQTIIEQERLRQWQHSESVESPGTCAGRSRARRLSAA